MANPSKPKASVSVGECISLRPTKEEAEAIWEAVKECGFEEDGQGVLKLLMLLLDDEEEEAAPNPIYQHFKNHPEDLDVVKSAVSQGLRAIITKIRK